MNAFRKNIVIRAFKQLDQDKSGQIDINDIKGVYSAAKHPDVVSRRKTEEDVLAEFLDTFELHYSIVVGHNT
ncbi:MAG: hypothetical protein P4L67_02295 [Candidatus Pacebacteria bacterium]|nr:hypothetical protein [Candidatus Paceibacterota bacterium]